MNVSCLVNDVLFLYYNHYSELNIALQILEYDLKFWWQQAFQSWLNSKNIRVYIHLTQVLFKWSITLKVKYEYSIVIQYAWLLNTWCLLYNNKVYIFLMHAVVFNLGLAYCVKLLVCKRFKRYTTQFYIYILKASKLFN